MSKKSKKMVKKLNNESKAFMRTVLRSGANNIGNQLMDAVSDANQPGTMILGNVLNALKSGAIATGQEVVRERLSRL
ncbi:hypothetical protein [Paenibacillus sp. PL2-23]|uniref:hypothetical protein n=1 Tax=Paenibacillus sp. PL2-23 TaxID=2100729 RepID=UPI0030FD19F3